MKKLVKMPSPAMIVAVTALVVALGGTAWAGIKIGTAQIKNKAVTPAKLSPSVNTLKGWVVIGATGNIVSRSSSAQVKSVTSGTQSSNSRSYCIDTGFEPKSAMVGSSRADAVTSSVLTPLKDDIGLPNGCPNGTNALVTLTGDFTDPNTTFFLATTVWFR